MKSTLFLLLLFLPFVADIYGQNGLQPYKSCGYKIGRYEIDTVNRKVNVSVSVGGTIITPDGGRLAWDGDRYMKNR